MLGINVDAGETGRIVGQASYGVILHMVKRWIKDEPREHLLRGVLHLGAALNPSTSVDGLSVVAKWWYSGMLAYDGHFFEFFGLGFEFFAAGWFVPAALVAIEMAPAGAVSRNSNPRRSWCPAVVLVKRRVGYPRMGRSPIKKGRVRVWPSNPKLELRKAVPVMK